MHAMHLSSFMMSLAPCTSTCVGVEADSENKKFNKTGNSICMKFSKTGNSTNAIFEQSGCVLRCSRLVRIKL